MHLVVNTKVGIALLANVPKDKLTDLQFYAGKDGEALIGFLGDDPEKKTVAVGLEFTDSEFSVTVDNQEFAIIGDGL